MTDITLSPAVYVALALNGIFTGLGSALGSYFANKHIIDKIKKLSKRVRGVSK